MSKIQDTGDIAEVPPEQRLEVDEGEGANALEGGDDAELDDIYEDPGTVVEEELA